MRLFGKNIFYLTYLDGSDIDLEKIKEVVKHGFELHGEKPFYSIIDFRDNFASMSPDGKKYLADQTLLNELRICEAVLVNNLPMKLIISGYFRLHKPKWPLKVFRKNNDLYTWLESFDVDQNDLKLLKEYFVAKETIASE